MARELEAKVARVMSATTIAINVGENAGVESGNEVVVWRHVDVKDPDTKESLGTVRLQNLRLTVSDVYERFALARVDTGSNILAGMFKPSKIIASSSRALDEDSVSLGPGDEVSVFVADLPDAPDDDDPLFVDKTG